MYEDSSFHINIPFLFLALFSQHLLFIYASVTFSLHPSYSLWQGTHNLHQFFLSFSYFPFLHDHSNHLFLPSGISLAPHFSHRLGLPKLFTTHWCSVSFLTALPFHLKWLSPLRDSYISLFLLYTPEGISKFAYTKGLHVRILPI